MTRKDFDITVDDASVHLARYCTPETVGRWAYALVGRQDRKPGGYVRRRVLEAFDEAAWEQKIGAIFHAVGYIRAADASDVVWDAGELTAPVMAAIADTVVEFHTDNLSDRVRNGIERALQMLGLKELSGTVVERWDASASKMSKAEIEALLDTLDQNFARTNDARTRDDAVAAPGQTDLSRVAVVVLRARECRDVETYFSESRHVSISTETLYLASALTHRPQWVALFESPVTLIVNGRKLAVDGASGKSNGQYVEVKFGIVDSQPAFPSVRIPIGTGKRTYPAHKVGHAALVLLDLLFSREENLETARAGGDTVFARKRLSPVGKTPSAVYRLIKRPQWATGEKPSRLSLSATTVNRRAHDVRGHLRTVDGVEYTVKPHRRQS